jgi:hypothetical protein
MRKVQTFFGLLLAATFALLSTAALAGEKQYVLTVASSSATPAAAYTFRFTNDGNSSFNALSLSLPGGWTISSGGGATATRGNVTLNAARNVVSVQNINLPTGSGQFMEVTVTGVTGTAACGAQAGTWAAQPWTGSSVGSGQKFNPKPNSGYPVSTTLPNLCFTITATAGPNGSISPSGAVNVVSGANQSFTITPNANYRIDAVTVDGNPAAPSSPYVFAAVNANHTINASFAANTLSFTPPSTAYVGQPFNVSVGYDGPAPASISLAWNCTPAANGSLTNNAPANPTTFAVTLTKAGTCTLTASAPGYFSASATIANVYTGNLGCDASTNKGGDLNPGDLKTYVKKTDQGKWGLVRGNNKDSASCVVVPYTCEVDVFATPQLSKFVVPDPLAAPFQKVAAKYVVVWGRFDVIGDASNIWASKRPNVSWGIPNPAAGSTDFVPALPCVLDPDNPDLASTYPNGFVSVPTADLDKLLPVIPNVAPYNTNPNLQFQPGQKAKMCIAQQGWTAVGTDAANPLDTTTDPVTVQVWTSVIDQGDGFMNLE